MKRLLPGVYTIRVNENGSIELGSPLSYTAISPTGTRCAVLILTSGTTSYTITFGSGFKPTGTLATGTTSARIFVVNWISDGTNLYEAGRTTAMVA